MVRDYQSLGTTPGVAVEFPALVEYRWHELLKRAAYPPTAGYAEIELVPS
jgi:hypothetical protein